MPCCSVLGLFELFHPPGLSALLPSFLNIHSTSFLQFVYYGYQGKQASFFSPFHDETNAIISQTCSEQSCGYLLGDLLNTLAFLSTQPLIFTWPLLTTLQTGCKPSHADTAARIRTLQFPLPACLFRSRCSLVYFCSQIS